MIKKYIFAICGLIQILACSAQISQVTVPTYIRISNDSIETAQIAISINGFLQHVNNGSGNNPFVLQEDLSGTDALSDEIKGMSNEPGSNKTDFFKCYLNNAILDGDHDYIIQLSYLGNYASNPVLRASFTLGVKKVNNQYFIYSLLKKNTDYWQVKKIGKFLFHFKKEANTVLIEKYVRKAEEFDTKLKARAYITDIYFCDNFLNALKTIGTDYKLDYNSMAHNNLTSFSGNEYLRVLGSSIQDSSLFDIHDLWHDRLHNIMDIKIINKPVDEGCAYLYGGSWGITWKEILKRFINKYDADADWRAIYDENKNFSTDFRHPLYPAYVINALFVQQLEKANRFGEVVKLLRCGKAEPGNENYFKELEQISGTTKSNFSMVVKELMQKAL